MTIPAKTLFLAFGLITVTTANAASECTCRYKGEDIPEGQTVCAQLPSGDVLMQCGKVLNNTAWKTIQNGCPTASLIYTPVADDA